MAEEIPAEIREELDRACELHERAAADYAKCAEFNELLSKIMQELEEAGCYATADKVMTLLLDCTPKEGARCDHSQRIGDKVRKMRCDR